MCNVDSKNFTKFRFYQETNIINLTVQRRDYDDNTPDNDNLRSLAIIDTYHDFFNGKGRAEQFNENKCQVNKSRITRARQVMSNQNALKAGEIMEWVNKAKWGEVFEYDETSKCFGRDGTCVDANKDEHIVLNALPGTGPTIDQVNNEIQDSMMNSFNISNIGLRITNWWAQQNEVTALATMKIVSSNQDSGVRNPNVPVYPTTFIADTNTGPDDH